MTCIRLMWTKIKFTLGYRTPPITERSLLKSNRVVSYMKHAEDRPLMSSVSKFLAVVMSSFCHVITVQAKFLNKYVKRRPAFSLILLRYENEASDAQLAIFLKFSNISAPHGFSGANAAPCFSTRTHSMCGQRCVFVILTLRLSTLRRFLNSGHAWAPVCNVCGVGGQMGYGRGMVKPRARGERFAIFRKAAEGCSPTLALA